jgi:hypothetical protein
MIMAMLQRQPGSHVMTRLTMLSEEQRTVQA